MKNIKLSLALAALALTPVAALAQSGPNVSEVVVTKISDIASPTLNRAANGELIMEFIDQDKYVTMHAHIDQALLRDFHRAARGTGKTLAAEVLARDHFKSVKITIRKGGAGSAAFERAFKANKPVKAIRMIIPVYNSGGARISYLEVKLENVLVSNWSTSGSENSVPTDSFSINFTKIKFEYKPQKDTDRS